MSELDIAPTEGALPAAAETPQEQPAETGKVEQTEAGEAPKPERKRSDGGFQRRINELTWKTRELERQLAESRRPAQPEQQPNFYENPEEAIRFLAKQEAEQRIAQERQYAERYQQEQRFAEIQRNFTAKADAFAEQHPDFHDAIAELDAIVPMPPFVAEVVGESERGPELAYYLAHNVQEAQQIAMLPPHLAAVRLARIESKLSAPVAKKLPSAPPPVATLGGSSVVEKDPSRMSYEDYKRFREGR